MSASPTRPWCGPGLVVDLGAVAVAVVIAGLVACGGRTPLEGPFAGRDAGPGDALLAVDEITVVDGVEPALDSCGASAPTCGPATFTAPSAGDARSPTRCDLDAPELVGQAVLAVLDGPGLQLLRGDGAGGQLEEVARFQTRPGQPRLAARGPYLAAAGSISCGEDCAATEIKLVDTRSGLIHEDVQRFQTLTHLGGREDGLFLFSLSPGGQLVVQADAPPGGVQIYTDGREFDVLADPGPDDLVLVSLPGPDRTEYRWWKIRSGDEPPSGACYNTSGPSGGVAVVGDGIVYALDAEPRIVFERPGQQCRIDVPGGWAPGTYPYLAAPNRQGWVMLFWDYGGPPEALQLLPASLATGEQRGPFAPVPPPGWQLQTDLVVSAAHIDAEGAALFALTDPERWQLGRTLDGTRWELLGVPMPLSPSLGVNGNQVEEKSGSYVAAGYRPVGAGGKSTFTQAIHPATGVVADGLEGQSRLSRDGRCLSYWRPTASGQEARLVLLDLQSGAAHDTAVVASSNALPATTFLPGDG